MNKWTIRFIVCLALASIASSSWAGKSVSCYVSGDTSGNDTKKPLGSAKNPYDSLAAVAANSQCNKIIVLYSGVTLDGGIVLRDGQKLEGEKGPGGELPVITNSALPPQGYGVVLARNNQLKHLHIRDTQDSGIFGSALLIPPYDFGGDVMIQSVLVTGANQSGSFEPLLGAAYPSIVLVPATDANITIKNSEIGAANVGSIGIFQLAGYGDVRISNTMVRDQGQLSDEFELSPGIWVAAVGDSSMDVVVVDTTVSNIGSEFQSNSDGLILVNSGTGKMTVKVDGYYYSNPDDGGQGGTSQGIEMGLIDALGASFDGVVTNSVIEGAYAGGIQVLNQSFDDDSRNNNLLNVQIRDNEIYDCDGGGISLDIGGSPFGSYFMTVENNLIVNTAFAGISFTNFISQQTLVEMLIQNNTVVGANYGLAFEQVVGASVDSLSLDAGLGGLGSLGQNRIIDSQIADVFVEAFDCCGFPPTPPFSADAANNWWGSDSGPATVVELGGATVNVDPYLTTDPN